MKLLLVLFLLFKFIPDANLILSCGDNRIPPQDIIIGFSYDDTEYGLGGNDADLETEDTLRLMDAYIIDLEGEYYHVSVNCPLLGDNSMVAPEAFLAALGKAPCPVCARGAN